jgi:hypothetical protein
MMKEGGNLRAQNVAKESIELRRSCVQSRSRFFCSCEK